MPRFLADECCDSAVGRSLRRAGHDVTAASEVAPGSDDSFVIGLATRDGRVVLTEDKDSGRFLLAQKQTKAGVLLLRFPASAGDRMPQDIVKAVRALGDRLDGAFVVVEPGPSIRPRPMKGP